MSSHDLFRGTVVVDLGAGAGVRDIVDVVPGTEVDGGRGVALVVLDVGGAGIDVGVVGVLEAQFVVAVAVVVVDIAVVVVVAVAVAVVVVLAVVFVAVAILVVAAGHQQQLPTLTVFLWCLISCLASQRNRHMGCVASLHLLVILNGQYQVSSTSPAYKKIPERVKRLENKWKNKHESHGQDLTTTTIARCMHGCNV